MTENYKQNLEKGEEYQDFVVQKCYLLGIPIIQFTSKKYQYTVGESMTRYEIKFDDRCAETGNLYIEFEERTSTRQEFSMSGIYRKDNTLFWIIGNYKKAFIFTKKMLQNMHASGKYKTVSTPTSKGMLLPIAGIHRIADVINFETMTINE